MAIVVGTSEPAEFTIGDTVSWVRRETQYQTPAWHLVYGFWGPTRFTVTTDDGTESLDHHIATLPTTGLKPGQYSWTVKATDGTQNITIGSGFMTALPNQYQANAELDALEAKLAAAEAAWHSLSIRTRSSVSVDGISYTLRNGSDLRDYIAQLKRDIAALINRDRVLLGRGAGGLYITRFRN